MAVVAVEAAGAAMAAQTAVAARRVERRAAAKAEGMAVAVAKVDRPGRCTGQNRPPST